MAEAPISEMEDEEFIDADDLEDSLDMEDKITKKQRR